MSMSAAIPASAPGSPPPPPSPRPRRSARPHLVVLEGGRGPTGFVSSPPCHPVRLPPALGRRAVAAPVRRRRLLVLAVVSIGLLLAIGRIDGGAATAAPPAPPRLDVSARGVYVVQPGDTLWSIARRLEPDGDVRGTVDRLVEMHGSAAVAVGDRIALDRPSRGP